MSLAKRVSDSIKHGGPLTVLKYIGPGFLVTVGFIDPGNWASNLAAGSNFGYSLLWMITLSTLMLIILQHNAAHLGIATGLCLSEASATHFRGWVSKTLLGSAMLAAVSTALAEILGAAIGLQMLFGLPLPLGALLTTVLALIMLMTNSYRKLEKWILGFVSLIGFSFLYELLLVPIPWPTVLKGWVVPTLPPRSLPIVMGVLGAVVMPHNLFLHSEVIQSRHWNLQEDRIIKKQLKYEFLDTLLAMLAGWAINSAMIILAGAVFFSKGIPVTELPHAQATLKPLLGNAASTVFALALLFSGFSSSITAGMAGGSVFSGIFRKPFAVTDRRSRQGIWITLGGGLLVVFLVVNPFQGLIWSQIILSIQLPWTVFPLIVLTSSRRVMGKYATPLPERIFLWAAAVIISTFNCLLLVQILAL